MSSEIGPSYGYFPNPSKTVLIVKENFNMPMARALFEKTGVKVTLNGDRHLGAVIGSKEKDKVSRWVKDVEELARIAKDEPQLAYSAYTKGLSHRWTYVQRTISDISQLFKPLEAAISISQKFIPAMLGREISETYRDIIALPLRLGGLGIANPVTTSEAEYRASTAISSQFTDLILQQVHDTTKLDQKTIKAKKVVIKQAKEVQLKALYKNLSEKLSLIRQKSLELGCEKGF